MKGHHWTLKLRALKRSLLATAGVSTIAVALGGAERQVRGRPDCGCN